MTLTGLCRGVFAEALLAREELGRRRRFVCAHVPWPAYWNNLQIGHVAAKVSFGLCCQKYCEIPVLGACQTTNACQGVAPKRPSGFFCSKCTASWLRCSKSTASWHRQSLAAISCMLRLLPPAPLQRPFF